MKRNSILVKVLAVVLTASLVIGVLPISEALIDNSVENDVPEIVDSVNFAKMF